MKRASRSAHPGVAWRRDYLLALDGLADRAHSCQKGSSCGCKDEADGNATCVEPASSASWGKFTCLEFAQRERLNPRSARHDSKDPVSH